MKQTAIKINEALLHKINTLKYQLGLKTQEDVLNRLIDLATPPIHTADNLPPKGFFSTKSDSLNHSLLKGRGKIPNKEKEK